MPDRDIFQRRFKGSGPLGWQGIARLLNYEPARLDVDSKINKAFARTLRKLPSNFMRNIVNLVRTAMAEEYLNRTLRNGKDAFLNLTYKLRVENGGNEFEVSETIKNAAQSFFLANRDRGLPHSEQAIVGGFAERVGEKLIDAQLFSKIRDVLQSKSGRDVSAEMSWERRMINRALPHVHVANHNAVFAPHVYFAVSNVLR